MSYDPSPQAQPAYAGARALDKGLQSYMQSVYSTMGWGLLVTGATAYAVGNTPFLFKLVFGGPQAFLFAIAPLVLILWGFRASRVMNLPAEKLKGTFTILSVLMGLSFGILFQIYTGASLARVFFITAAAFAATSLYGYTTKTDLTSARSFLFMGLFGLIIASLVNLFLHSAMVQFVISIAGVLVFTGLTAWQTQSLKNVYRAGATEANSKMAILGALNLYLNFINLFQIMLSFMGDRR